MQNLSPAVRRFQQIRKNGQDKAIARRKIQEANPKLSPKQVESILASHLRLKERSR